MRSTSYLWQIGFVQLVVMYPLFHEEMGLIMCNCIDSKLVHIILQFHRSNHVSEEVTLYDHYAACLKCYFSSFHSSQIVT